MKKNIVEVSPMLNEGKDQIIHFSHANGFPPLSYRCLLEQFEKEYQVIASELRPLWSPESEIKRVKSWQVFADDLIMYLDENVQQKVYGVGHSLGAVVTFFAAIKRPDLFNAVVLIEPAMLPATLIRLFYVLPPVLKRQVPIIKKAWHRQDFWDSKQAAYEHYRRKRTFRRVSDEVLWDYIESGTKNTGDNGVTLKYSKAWEIHCYSLLPNIRHYLKKCQVPVLGIRAEESDSLFPSQWQRWKKANLPHKLVEIPNASHLVPFENPTAISELALDFISQDQINE